MKKFLSSALFLCLSGLVQAGSVMQPMTFHRNLELAQWQPTTTVASVTQTNAGAFAATQTLYYAVVPTNLIGQAAPSGVQTVTVAAVSNKVLITWLPTMGANGYRVYRGHGSTTLTNYMSVASATSGTNSFTDHGTNTWSVGSPTNTASAVYPIISIPIGYVGSDSNAVVPRWWIEQYLIVSNENDTLDSVLGRGAASSNRYVNLAGGTGRVDAAQFRGDGSMVSNVNASQLGGLAAGAFPASTDQSNKFMQANGVTGTNTHQLTVSNKVVVTGSVTAASFTGDGSALTNLQLFSGLISGSTTQAWVGVTNAGVGGNQITNGTFDLDTLWAKTTASIDTNTGVASITPGTAGSIQYSNILVTIPGRTYQLGWKQICGSVNYAYITLTSENGLIWSPFNLNLTLTSNSVAARFVATGSNTQFSFTANPAPAGYFNLDDVTFEEIRRGDLFIAHDVGVGGSVIAGAATNVSFPFVLANVGANDRRYFRWVAVPASNNASGAQGQFATTNNYFYFYTTDAFGTSGGWIRIPGTNTW